MSGIKKRKIQMFLQEPIKTMLYDPILQIVRKFYKRNSRKANEILIKQLKDFMDSMNYEFVTINPYRQRIEEVY